MSAAEPVQGARAAQAKRTAVALKAAARRVFARRGYLDAKVTDIAAEADRSVGSFYKHFPSKEDILHALLVDWTTQSGEELVASDAGDDLTQEPALRARVATYWRTYQEHLPEIRALGQAALVNPAFAERVRATRHAQLQTLREHLEHLQANGIDLPGPPTVVASAFNALLEGFCDYWLSEASHPAAHTIDDAEAISTLTQLLRRGLIGG